MDFQFLLFVSIAGVQIAYFIIIGTQLSMIILSIGLILGIYRVSILVFIIEIP